MRTRIVLAVSTAFGLLVGSAAPAAPLYTYDWSNSSGSVASDSTLNAITFANQPLITAMGDTNIIASNISVQAPFVGDADTWTNKGFSLVVKLTDAASSETGILTFAGYINGYATPDSANIVTKFTDPTSQALPLGGVEYTVS